MKDNEQVSSTEAEQAMQQVLQAELDAESAVHDCENEAQQAIHDALISAQRIHTHANQRITNMEMRHGHKMERLVKDIEREGAAELRHDTGQYDDKNRLQSIVEKLAVELCMSDSTSDVDRETGK
jgi:vacuolar-type H+-ATPase subunit H